MYNPYEYDPELDKDLFEEEETKAKKSSDSDAYDSVLNEILTNNNIPADQREKLRHTLEGLIPNVSSMTVVGFLDYDKGSQQYRQDSSMNRAMMHVLDEITDGRVIALWRLFDIEKQAVSNRRMLDVVNNIYTMVQVTDKLENKIPSLEFILDIINTRLERLQSSYNLAMEHVDNYEPDYSVFEMGTKREETKSWVKKIMFWRRNDKT